MPSPHSFYIRDPKTKTSSAIVETGWWDGWMGGWMDVNGYGYGYGCMNQATNEETDNVKKN